jgi:hypothetical protein
MLLNGDIRLVLPYQLPYSLAKLNDALFSNGEGLEPNFSSEKLGVSDFWLASLEGLFSQP